MWQCNITAPSLAKTSQNITKQNKVKPVREIPENKPHSKFHELYTPHCINTCDEFLFFTYTYRVSQPNVIPVRGHTERVMYVSDTKQMSIKGLLKLHTLMTYSKFNCQGPVHLQEGLNLCNSSYSSIRLSISQITILLL